MSGSTANRVCEKCGHFRSEHPRGQACSCGGCDAFRFTPPARKPRRRVFTDEEVRKAKEMLDAGATYTETARKLDRQVNSVAVRFPGYGGNFDRDAQKKAAKELQDRADRAREAWRRVWAAEREERGLPPGRTGRGCRFGGGACDRPTYAQGLCRTHYMQWRATGELYPIGSRMGRHDKRESCTFDGCGRPHYGNGLCCAHWNQRRRGSELKPIKEQK